MRGINWRTGFITAGLGAALILGACQAAEDKIAEVAAGDPVPAGMGTLATTASVAGVSAIASFVSQAAEASPALKPGPGTAALGFFPEQSSMACVDGGSVGFSNQSSTGFTATFSGCADGPYTANATAVITNMTTQTCTEDGADHEVPAALTATVNGTISIDGQTVTFTNFGVALSNPQYSEGEGGTCAIEAADIHATGRMSTVTAGQTTTVDLGTSSLDISFQGGEGFVQATIDGTLTVDTVCTDGAMDITITTLSDLYIADDDATPTGGVIAVNEAVVDFGNNPAPPIPCSGFLS